MLETGNDVYIELVEMKQSMEPVGESEVFWHLALRTDHLEKSLEAAINAGCEVTVPIRPLDLMNNVTTAPWSVRVAFFRGSRRRADRTIGRQDWLHLKHALPHSEIACPGYCLKTSRMWSRNSDTSSKIS